MTSCWSKGRSKLSPYFPCVTPDCPSKRNSIRRADIESGALGLMRGIQPAVELVSLATVLITDLWEMRLSRTHASEATLRKQMGDID